MNFYLFHPLRKQERHAPACQVHIEILEVNYYNLYFFNSQKIENWGNKLTYFFKLVLCRIYTLYIQTVLIYTKKRKRKTVNNV